MKESFAYTQFLIQRISRIALPLYCAFVSYCAIVPLYGWRVPSYDIIQHLMFNWIDKIFLFDVIQNLLLYLPLGVFAVFAVSTQKRSAFASLSLAFMLSLIFSGALEIIQAYNPVRVSSALDIILNTLSGVLGALFTLFVYYPSLKVMHAIRTHYLVPASIRYPLPWLGWMMLFSWWIYQWYPFLPTLEPVHLQQGSAYLVRTFKEWDLLDLHRVVSYFSQVFLLYCCMLVSLRKGHFVFILSLLILVLPFKILMIGRVLSMEAVIGSLLGLMIAALLHAMLKARHVSFESV